MGATSKESSRSSPPDSPQVLPVPQTSEQGEARAPYKTKSIDIEEDGPVTTWQQIPSITTQFDTLPPFRSQQNEANLKRRGNPDIQLESRVDDSLGFHGKMAHENENHLEGNTQGIDTTSKDNSSLRGHEFTMNHSYHNSLVIQGSVSPKVLEELLGKKARSRNKKAAGAGWTSSDTNQFEYGGLSRQTQARGRLGTIATRGLSTGKASGRSESDGGVIQGSPLIDQRESSILGPIGSAVNRDGLMSQDPLPPRLNETDKPRPEELQNPDILAKNLPHPEVPAADVGSAKESSFGPSHSSRYLPQGANDDEVIPDHKEKPQPIFTSNTKPEIHAYKNKDEDTELHRDEEDIRSDGDSCADETMSVQSYADTVFDADSVGSSASSFYSDTQALVGEYVDFLVRDPGLEKLFMRSMLPTVLGSDRFRRNYSRILQSYARDLKRQLSIWNEPKISLSTQGLTQGLAFISRRTITVKTASIIASRYMEKAPRTQFYPGRTEYDNSEVLEDEEISSGDESPVNESNQNFMISELGQYFREGAPFQRMKRNLRNLVIPKTGLSRVKASTERLLDLVLGDECLRFLLFKALSDPLVSIRDDQFDPETGIRYFGSRLKAEANSPDHMRLAEFIETYAGYIGTRAVQRIERMNTEEIIQDAEVGAYILCYLRCLVTQSGVFQVPTDSGPMSKFDAHNRRKIIVEDKRYHQEVPSHAERQTSRTSKLLRAISQARRGAFGTSRLILFNLILVCTFGKVIEILADRLDQYPIARLTTIFMFAYLFEDELNTPIATLLWCCSAASEERQSTSAGTLRYFQYKWSIGDGEDSRQKLHSHIWKPYGSYLSSKSEEVLETIMDDNLPDLFDANIDTHWHFVSSSEIFKEYVDTLRDTAIPTFFSQAKRLVAEGLVGDEDPNAAVGKNNLLSALEEVQWCFTQSGVAPSICIPASEPSLESFRVSNLAKLAIEASSQTEWQWWPLQPPKSRGKAGDTECRMSWKCNCGTEREEVVPFVYASKLSHLASQFPLSNEPPDRPPSSLSNSSSQATESSSGSGAQSTGSSTLTAAGSSSLRSGTAATSQSSSVISFGTPPKAFVFLVVKASRYTLAPIDVTEKKARDFFQAIVEKYNQKRGWWRRLLSIYVYSHCDFVKIERYAPYSFSPGLRFSFPPHDKSPHNKEYRYNPQPMTDVPIPRHMFYDLFNVCYSDEGLAHKLQHAFIAPCRINKSVPGKLLDKMPKRDREVNEEAEFSEDQDVEVFWGLVAREQRSALRVAVYMFFGLGPSLWFTFQWLFVWGHDGDLQNATVPLMFSATLLGVWWAFVYSGDNIREMEQPR